MKKKYCKGCFNDVTDSGICECGEHANVGTFNEEEMEQIEKEIHEHLIKPTNIEPLDNLIESGRGLIKGELEYLFYQKQKNSIKAEDIDVQGSIEKISNTHIITNLKKIENDENPTA